MKALKKSVQAVQSVVGPDVLLMARVDKLLREAGKGAATMVEKTRAAALEAMNELPTKGKVAERVNAVVKIHAKTFNGIDKNVKALFVNILTIAAAPKGTVVEVKPASGKQGAVIQPAHMAVQLISKNKAAEAAKQIRDAEGSGRAPKANQAPKAEAAVSAEASFYAALKNHMADPAASKRVISILRELGYEVTQKAVSKPAKPKGPSAKAVKVTPVEVKPLASIVGDLDEDMVTPPVLTNQDKANLVGIPAAD